MASSHSPVETASCAGHRPTRVWCLLKVNKSPSRVLRGAHCTFMCPSLHCTGGLVDFNNDCNFGTPFCRQTKEQFTVEYYPDNTPDAGFVLLRNRPSVEACKLAGGQPVLTVAFAGAGVQNTDCVNRVTVVECKLLHPDHCFPFDLAEPWDLDTAKLTLELQYVASNVALNRLEVRSKTFKLCGTGAINRIAASNTFTYHTFRLCASEGGCADAAWNWGVQQR